MNNNPNKFEWTILIIFILAAIIIFFYKIVTPLPESNQLTIVLLDVFGIILSLYIGYFLQRLDSAKTSREILKKQGFLAYRRIMDIQKSLNRSFREITRIKKTIPNEINALQSILEGTFDTVESSILDWVDIIGDELNKKEKVNHLEEKLANARMQPELGESDKRKLEDIKNELEKLRVEIPFALRTNTNEEKHSKYFGNILENKGEDGSITLQVRITLEVPLSQESKQSIVNDSPYLLKPSYRDFNIFIDVYNKDKCKIGVVVPSIEYDRKVLESGITNNAFIREYEDDEMKLFLLDFDNMFSLSTTEDSDGFCVPARCDFAGFVNSQYFEILFLSEEFPRG